ncbi:MAG: VCBS repeat-containing protein [Polyangiaceae bacterium]|nr:VCBS repeat-containing protein [Polyangiaceae bacterium]
MLSVRLGNGDGTLSDNVDYRITGIQGLSGVLGDLNGDGTLDVVTADASPSAMSVLLGPGDGTFPSEVNYSVDATALALGDVNGDGRLDVVAAESGGSVSVMLASCR